MAPVELRREVDQPVRAVHLRATDEERVGVRGVEAGLGGDRVAEARAANVLVLARPEEAARVAECDRRPAEDIPERTPADLDLRPALGIGLTRRGLDA